MLIASLLVFSAVTVNGLRDNEHGPRRTKQLGLQYIQASVKEEPTLLLVSLDKNRPINNGYLPPASPSSSIVGAQSIQTFEFEPLNSLEKDEPCNSASCNDSSSDSIIPKPSRDLVPPFNDLEQETATFSPKQEDIQSTTPPQIKFTTTEKLVTASSLQVTTRAPLKSSKRPATTPKVFATKAEATNELRSYLPPQPEFSAAAQTNVAVVQPSRPNTNHDHHHGHHHGKDFDICADAFHSFLCAPLKARKRITGAFPSSLRGQSSFINYQKLLPNYEREPAPSNTLQNAYLPPKRVSAATNLIQATKAPPLTTRPVVVPTLPSRPPPKVLPEPSNSNNRFYLPPLTDNKIVPAPSSETAFKFPKITPTLRPAAVTSTRTTFSSAFSNPPITRAPVVFNTASSQQPVFNFSPSNDNRFYLPPKINPQPAPSFTATSTVVHPVTPTVSSQPSVSTLLPIIVTESVSTTRKPQTVFSTYSAAPRPSTTTAKPQPTVSSTFVTSSPTFQVPTRPPPSFNSVSQFPSTKKPFSSSKFSGQLSNEDRSYLPPDVNLAAAAQTNSAAVAPQNPFHHGRDLCTDPFHSFLCVSSKPRKRITGQLPSGITGDSSNTQEARLKPNDKAPLEGASAQNLGYKYPQPSASPNIIPSPTATSTGYSYPKPNQPPASPNLIPSPTATSTGYFYPKPNQPPASPNLIPSPTATSTGYSYPKPNQPPASPNLIPSPTATSTGYTYPKPVNVSPQRDIKSTPVASSTTAKPEPRPSEARIVSGYQYPKPEDSFLLPGEQTRVPTTTAAPTTGYSYPKPQKPLSLPTEQKEVQKPPPPKGDVASPTTQPKGYQYPKPEQSLKLPEKSGGYTYPKPAKRLELPTESRLKLQANPSLDPLGALGSVDFIPVNKIDYKRSESKLVAGLRRFGERQKKRQREAAARKRE